MDKPISVGDLVVVIRGNGCGCASSSVGTIWTVTQIGHSTYRCVVCGATFPATLCVENGTRYRDGICFKWAVDRLKRIPPLDELESEKREETVNA